MKFKATFKGVNSLGYENGKEYILFIADYKSIAIARFEGGGFCRYKSFSAFFNNWDSVSEII